MNVLGGDRSALSFEHRGNPKEKKSLLRKCFAWTTRYIYCRLHSCSYKSLVIESGTFYDLSKSIKRFNNINIVLRLGLTFINTILREFVSGYSFEMHISSQSSVWCWLHYDKTLFSFDIRVLVYFYIENRYCLQDTRTFDFEFVTWTRLLTR